MEPAHVVKAEVMVNRVTVSPGTNEVGLLCQLLVTWTHLETQWMSTWNETTHPGWLAESVREKRS